MFPSKVLILINIFCQYMQWLHIYHLLDLCILPAYILEIID